MNEGKFEPSYVAVCQGNEQGAGMGTDVQRHRDLKKSKATLKEFKEGNEMICTWHTVDLSKML
jgi:hypothetical protein